MKSVKEIVDQLAADVSGHSETLQVSQESIEKLSVRVEQVDESSSVNRLAIEDHQRDIVALREALASVETNFQNLSEAFQKFKSERLDVDLRASEIASQNLTSPIPFVADAQTDAPAKHLRGIERAIAAHKKGK